MQDRIVVQTEDFDVQQEYQALIENDQSAGAALMFVGRVRDMNEGDQVKTLHLEHYPAMTEKALAAIVAEARDRWPLNRVTVIHRFGDLHLTDQIVLVAVSSAHRKACFEAGEFLMDYLKTRAPFWKKEQTPDGERWVDARDTDMKDADRW